MAKRKPKVTKNGDYYLERADNLKINNTCTNHIRPQISVNLQILLPTFANVNTFRHHKRGHHDLRKLRQGRTCFVWKKISDKKWKKKISEF